MKKTLSMILAATMICASLTSCSSDSGSGTSSSGGGNAGSGAIVGGADDSIYTENGTYPILKDGETLTLEIFGPQRPGVNTYASPTNLTTTWLEETTGIDFTFETALEVDIQQKFNTMMLGGDYPDVIAYAGLTLSEQLLYGQQGSIIPLNDLIDNYMPNLSAMLEKYPGSRESITHSDGNIYVLPQLGSNVHSRYPQKMWINQVWLDNLGLEMPTTTEQFKEVLIAFKEQDANGNGDPNDEVPLTGCLTGWNNDPIPFLMNAFGAFNKQNDNLQGIGIDENGVVYYPKAEDYWADGLKYMNELYSLGLIDSLMFSQTQGDLQALGTNPDAALIGACAGGSIGAFLPIGSSDRWMEYVAVAPLTGPDGFVQSTYAPVYGRSGYVITDKCQDPIAVARAFDLFFTDEGMMYNFVGVEGTDYVPAEEGDLNVEGEQAQWTRLTNSSEAGDNYWNQFGTWGIYDFDLIWTGSQDSIETVLYLESVNKYEPLAPALDTFMPPVALTEEQSRTIVEVGVPMNAYEDTIFPEFIMGTKDIDAEWPAHIAELEGYGLSNYLQVYQDVHDAKG